MCACKDVCVRKWYCGRGSLSLSTAVFGVRGVVRVVISRPIRLTSVGKRTKTTCEGEQQVCHVPHLGYPDRFLRVL